MKAPAFQFYADDFLAGTADMTAEEVGVYIRLLCHQWSKGGLPNDPERLALMSGGNAKPHALAKFGMCHDGMLRNARLEQERGKQVAFREKQAKNGQKRWLGNAKPQGLALPTHVPNACSPSPSPSPSTKIAETDYAGAGAKPVAFETNPQITPPTLDAVQNMATIRAVALDAAEQFFLDSEARGWIDGVGQPIRNWPSALVAYGKRWRARESQKRTINGKPAPQSEADRDFEKTGRKTEFHLREL
jgi:uncharacterized protein YdaU (DUF1376 family)